MPAHKSASSHKKKKSASHKKSAGLADKTVLQLRKLAKQKHVTQNGKNKKQLISAIQRKN